MPSYRSCLLLPLIVLAGCGSREASSPSTPAPASAAVSQAAQPLAVETRRALIAQRLAKRPLSEALRARLVEAWVAGSDGFDQAGMDRLLGAIDSSIEAVDENRFNASKDLILGRPAVAGSTIVGALISGLVAEPGGRLPIAIDCGGIRANGWVERGSTRSNRAAVIITSLSVHDSADQHVTYQHPEGLAYLMGPDGLEGLTLQAVTDQRGNSWLGLRAGTLVTLILIRTVDQSLAVKTAAEVTPAKVTQPASAPAPASTPADKKPEPPVTAPAPAPAQPAPAQPAPVAPVDAVPAVPTEKPADAAPAEKPSTPVPADQAIP